MSVLVPTPPAGKPPVKKLVPTPPAGKPPARVMLQYHTFDVAHRLLSGANGGVTASGVEIPPVMLEALPPDDLQAIKEAFTRRMLADGRKTSLFCNNRKCEFCKIESRILYESLRAEVQQQRLVQNGSSTT